ncbi:hypothetical protein [Microbacterium forte]
MRSDSLVAHVILGAQPFVERDRSLQSIGVAAQRPRCQPFPVRAGADNVARFLLGIAAKNPHFTVEERQFGEGLGLVFRDGGRVHSVMNLHVEDGVAQEGSRGEPSETDPTPASCYRRPVRTRAQMQETR